MSIIPWAGLMMWLSSVVVTSLLSRPTQLTQLTNLSIVISTKTGRTGLSRARPPSQEHDFVNYWGRAETWGEWLESSHPSVMSDERSEMTGCEHLSRDGSPGRWWAAASCPVMDITINTYLSVGYYYSSPRPAPTISQTQAQITKYL